MPRRHVFWSLAACAVLAAAVQAWVLRWTCDDAFISFRYAQNLAEGHGLVFNLDPGEAPVEGYTNFVWTLWLALAVKLGWSDGALETWSIVWGIAAHAGTVLLLAAIAWRASGGRALVPIAACGYAAIHHASSLAPAGLETALFVLLVTAILRSCLQPIAVRGARWLGALGVLAAMTRPDGAILCAIAGPFVLHDAVRARTGRLVFEYALPFVAVFLPYLLWRHSYYGYWLPNTFYAKSGSDPCLAMGWAYVRDFLVCYWPLLLPFVPLAWFAARGPAGREENELHGRRPWLAIGAFVGSYLAFVVWVGGDFMFGRFLLPILPALLLALDLACVRWLAAWLQPALAVVVVLGCVFRVEPNGLHDHRNAVSDNRTISFHPVVLNGPPIADVYRTAGEYLRQLFAGLDVRLAIAGGHASFAYRSRVPVAIECAGGLTDAHIARLPVPVAGKRGHDKPRDRPYLERRGVHFMLEINYEGDFGKVDTWRDVTFPAPPIGFPMRLVTWDRELMRELRARAPATTVQDFEQFLDAYIAELPKKTKEQVRADYAKFLPFYFARNDDPQRRAAFEKFLQ